MKTKIILITLLAFMPAAAMATSGDHPAPQPGSAEFERIKSLAGTWEGESKETGQDDQKVNVEYEITSGGNAVVERLFKGTPHEMVSVYYDKDGKLNMTHYCMLPNRPQLELTRSEGDRIDLELEPASPMNQTGEPHMHALTIAFSGPDKVQQTWIGYEGGEPKDSSTVLTLSRVR